MKRFLATSLAVLTLVSGAAASAQADDHNGHRNHSNQHQYNTNYSRYGHNNDNWDRDRAQSRAVYYYAPSSYHAPPRRPRVVYVYPHYDYFPRGYERSYIVGGYLPRDRYWYPLPTYVAQSLPAPRYGERWVYADRDAVLISEATSRIISGIVLAASIN